MSERKYVSNTELVALLNKATETELTSLTSIIKGDQYSADTPNLSPVEICQKLCGVEGYLKVVDQVVDKLDVAIELKDVRPTSFIDDYPLERKVSKANLRYVEKCEDKIILKVLETAYENMSKEDKEKFDKSLQEVASRYGKSANGLVGATGLVVVANLGGFSTYMLMSSLLSTLSFGMLGFGAYTAASSILHTLIGPVGWVGLAVYALYKLGQPDYKVKIPAVATIGILRKRVKYEAEQAARKQREKEAEWAALKKKEREAEWAALKKKEREADCADSEKKEGVDETAPSIKTGFGIIIGSVALLLIAILFFGA